MPTTMNLDDDLLRRAAELTGRTNKAILVRLGHEALITQESSRRLAGLGGSDVDATAAERHRPSA